MVWKEARDAFDRGDADILSGIAYSDQRSARIDYSIPHSTLAFALVVRQGDGRIRSEQDLGGRVILTEASDVMQEYLASRGFCIQGTKSPHEALALLAESQGDCAVVPTLTWRRDTPKDLARRLSMVQGEHFPVKYCFGVRKGNTALLARLNEGLFRLIDDGTMARLQDRYFGSTQAEDIPWQRVLRHLSGTLISMLLGGALLATLLLSLALRRIVQARTAALLAELGRRKQVESEQILLQSEIQERSERLEAALGELQQAMEKTHELSGLIPICAGCKQIRDDQGYWHAVDRFLEAHSTASFIAEPCADCEARDDSGGGDA